MSDNLGAAPYAPNPEPSLWDRFVTWLCGPRAGAVAVPTWMPPMPKRRPPLPLRGSYDPDEFNLPPNVQRVAPKTFGARGASGSATATGGMGCGFDSRRAPPGKSIEM